MEEQDNFEQIIQDCNESLQTQHSLSLANMKLFGDSWQSLSDAFDSIFKIDFGDIVELYCGKYPQTSFLCLIEYYRVLQLQDDTEFQNLGFTKYAFNKKYPEIEQLAPECGVYFSRIDKVHKDLSKNLYSSLPSFDFSKVQIQALEYIDKFDFSSEGPFSYQQMVKCSRLAGCLQIFILSTTKFCKKLLEVKPYLKYQYDRLGQTIETLVNYLQNKEAEQKQFEQISLIEQNVQSSFEQSEQNHQSKLEQINKSALEQKITSVLLNISEKFTLEYFESPFLIYLYSNTDFHDWVLNDRPLALWKRQRENDNEKFKELLKYYQYYYPQKKEEEVNACYFKTVGFEFLQILKLDELRQIQYLDISPKHRVEARLIFENISLLNQLQLRVLKLSYVFMDTIGHILRDLFYKQIKIGSGERDWNLKRQKQEIRLTYPVILPLIFFLRSQHAFLEELSIIFCTREHQAKKIILKELSQFKNLKKLELENEYDHQYDIDVKSYANSIAQFQKLEYIKHDIQFDISRGLKEKTLLKQFKYPITIKSLEFIQRYSSLKTQPLLLTLQFSYLTNLQNLSIEFKQYKKKEENIELLETILKNLKDLSLRKLKLKLEEHDQWYAATNNIYLQRIDVYLLKFYKLKRLVKFQIIPSLQKFNQILYKSN